MKYGILPTLTKPYILNLISQEQIFERYLGIKVVEGLINVPNIIRHDNNPTGSFYYSNNHKLRFKDHAGYFHGDCFDIVAFVLRVDANTKQGFSIVLDQIARDFNLHKYANEIKTGNTIDIREASIKAKTKTLITFQPRTWTKQDADFWTAGNINKKGLEEGRVYPCLYIWINNQLIYNFNPKDPAYAYVFTPSDIKIYFPFRDKFRFIGNTSYLQGIDLIEPDEFLIITKSYKDILSMKSFGLQAIAPHSESTLLTKQEWNKVKPLYSHHFSLMDFDRQGISMAIQLYRTYGIQPLFFSNYKKHSKLARNFKSFNKVKDFYDFVNQYGKQATINLIEETKEYFQDSFDAYDEYYNTILKFNNKNNENDIPF